MGISKPHDKFFKDVFSRPEVAQDFCRHYLPREIVKLLNLSTLTQAKDSFVDENLRESFSDLLFKIKLKTGRDIYIYILFEHKSHRDPMVLFQILRSEVKIWDNDRKQRGNSKLRPIIPLVIYHGRRKWNVPLDFHSLFLWTEGMEKYLPQFEYLLFDIPRMKDEQIGGDALLKALLMVLKYIKQRDPREKAARIATAFRELKDKRSDIEEILYTVLLYLYQTIKAEDQTQVQQEFERTLREGAEIMPTLAEYYIQQGIEEGRKEGKQEGLQEGLQQGLQRGIQKGREEGKKEGKQEGLQEGLREALREAREAVLDILQTRFNKVPRRMVKKITAIDDMEQLRELRKKSLTVSTLKEFDQHLQ
jgi:predicted transposase/invertase (TIGR01784 family)